MKTILFLILLPIYSFAAESKYTISKDGDKFFLQSEKAKWELLHQAQEPKILEIRKLTPEHELVIYQSEEAGTKYIIQMDKAVVVDTKNAKLLSLEPLDFKYTNLQTKEVESEATYQVKDKKLLWKFEDEGTIVQLERSAN